MLIKVACLVLWKWPFSWLYGGLVDYFTRIANMRFQDLCYLFISILTCVNAQATLIPQDQSLNPRTLDVLVKRDLPIGTCNPDTPCPNGACCGSNGLCGYSAAECGAGCASNCDAKAQCGQYGTPGQNSCPLNVCCSQFG
jgi:chitinase